MQSKKLFVLLCALLMGVNQSLSTENRSFDKKVLETIREGVGLFYGAYVVTRTFNQFFLFPERANQNLLKRMQEQQLKDMFL